MRKLLLILLIVCGLMSCLKSVDEKEFLRSYVMTYMGTEGIFLNGYDDSNGIREITISPAEKYHLGSYYSKETKKDVYDALCEKHGDMTFMRDFVVQDGFGEYSTSNIGVDFLSIDITSDSPFDEEHSAGVSLGDIVTFSSYSLKPYIDSGYTDLYDNNVYHPIVEQLSELTPNDLILLGMDTYIGTLVFDSEPTLSKTHTFTVTMTADDGRVFSDSIEMTF
jgi:hypothetical protein